jgi:pimeloyl-ACP methyl ester carboxylesterase
MVNTQHRYYNGVPESLDGNTTGLQYLSSEQALADLAALTAHLNRQFAMQNGSHNLKWIHIGGSYGGNMAAWYRLKYPHLSVGAFSISAPVQAVVDYTG